jgi:hypothetical protein
MVPFKLLDSKTMTVMSPSAQVTPLLYPLESLYLHEHGSRSAPLQSLHPAMLVALAKTCHAAHETAYAYIEPLHNSSRPP